MEQNNFLEEFIIFPSSTEASSSMKNCGGREILQVQNKKEENAEVIVSWTTNQTKLLLDFYKQFRPKVGSFEVKNLKKLWQIIATKINEVLSSNFSANHVENRWRVVARSYKKFVDNQKKTGSGRKCFEYKEEMDEIFNGKKNIKPDVLLSTDTIDIIDEIEPIQANASDNQSTERNSSTKRKYPSSRNIVLEQIRSDRKEHNSERISLMKERNELLRERNELLKNRKCSSCSKDF